MFPPSFYRNVRGSMILTLARIVVLSLQEILGITNEDREAPRAAVKSLERRPTHQPRRQARRTDRLRDAVFRFESDHVGDLEGIEAALKVALPTLPHHLGSIRSFCTGACNGLGRRGRNARIAGASGRTACVDHHHAAFDRGHRRHQGRGSVRSRGCPLLRRGLRTGRPIRLGRRVRERIFRRPKHASQDSNGSRPIRRQTGCHQGRSSSAPKVRYPGRRTIWGGKGRIRSEYDLIAGEL
jgi:hypothetical protein